MCFHKWKSYRDVEARPRSIDCAFQKAADAEAYINELNSDKAKAIARCKELIALRDSESMVQYLVEEYAVGFGIVAVELK